MDKMFVDAFIFFILFIVFMIVVIIGIAWWADNYFQGIAYSALSGVNNRINKKKYELEI